MKLSDVQAEYQEVLEEMDASALAVLRLGREMIVADKSRQLMNKATTDALSEIAVLTGYTRHMIYALMGMIQSADFLWPGAEIDDA